MLLFSLCKVGGVAGWVACKDIFVSKPTVVEDGLEF